MIGGDNTGEVERDPDVSLRSVRLPLRVVVGLQLGGVNWRLTRWDEVRVGGREHVDDRDEGGLGGPETLRLFCFAVDMTLTDCYKREKHIKSFF